MNEIFGVSMNGIVSVLLVLLGLSLLVVGWVALRRPVIFKLGVRNLPRRKAQTTLIIVGLMLSTLITAAALGVGDTLDHSFNKDVYDNLGHVDQVVVAGQDQDAETDVAATRTFDAGKLALVEQTVAGDSNVDGVMPLLEARVPVRNDTAQLAEPDVVLVGLDPARLDRFGGIRSTGGENIDYAALDQNQVVLSEESADELGATVGDTITLFYGNAPHQLTVAAVAEDTFLAGARRSVSTGLEVPGMSMPLAALQTLTGQPNGLTSIAISFTGGARDTLDANDAVLANLEQGLAGQGLAIDQIKHNAVDLAEEITAFMTGLFLVLGLFSIAAGVLLIVLIFTMLAAERRSEMGMARAVGMHRRQLIQSFVSEGATYAVLAGLVGSLLGVLAAIGLGLAMSAIFGDFVPIDPLVTPRSLIAAYSLGVVITFATVVGSSWKVSRLNVVAAVRDIPDVVTRTRRKRTLVWAGLLLLFGGLLTVSGVSSGTLFSFATGMSLLPFGVAMILQYFGVPSRPIFTTIGLYLLVFWLLPEDQFSAIFGDYSGDFEMFFVSGIFMTIAATIVIVNNLDLLLAGISRLGGLFRAQLPAIRTAISYPGAAKGRTGMTIAMFSLIVFSLVMIATMNQNFVALFLGDEANAGWDVRADARTANPIDDFTGTVAAAGVETDRFTEFGTTTTPADTPQLRAIDAADSEWGEYPVVGMDEAFIASSDLLFGQRARGYESDAAILEALQSQPNVAIVDAFAVESDDFGDSEDQFKLSTVNPDDEVFEPVQVELAGTDGAVHTVTIIGVLDSKIGSLFGLYGSQSTIEAIYPESSMTSYYIALDDPDKAEDVAKEIESALLTNGVQATSIRDQLEEGQRQSTGFLYMVQGFMGLGLLVGVAAVGVVAFRSVVERRQQIGVLRALGYQRSMVSLSFVIETAFVVGLGVLSGTAMAIVLARNLFTSDDFGSGDSDFFVPWGIISVVLVATVAVALLMTWVPSRQAARISPAEALRYE